MKTQAPSFSKVLSIAGSDTSGGAGIQADIKTITALGCYATTVVTALTAQNSLGVHSIFEVPASFVGEQIDAVMTDIGTDAVKTGMLMNKDVVEVVCSKVREYKIERLVVDPVILSKNGRRLLTADAVRVVTVQLFPLALLVTPNIPEATDITGLPIKSISDAEEAARSIYQLGPAYVLIKGGHAKRSWDRQGKDKVIDIVYDGKGFEYIEGDYIRTDNTHGTGCTYASAIAAFLAKGNGLVDAVVQAKEFVTTAIQKSFELGRGYGTLDQYHTVQLP
ncbi:MAG: bifunctional hydroxymethylpyrimidine kinase/phosphomethylpyrimidine kinase [Candidatus Brocadia sp.]|nr:Hydroxymethylpyrimidine/phosphomethylpyrimidine kinase [Candidatus Brocadia fulgida]MCC6324606.1 bifunctional hydroxymethylpyrimidine kinase/phosphomethylpyrimidine kinase [Candidatus Brocadia sp.]MCE7910296.1 bifunctional hydroxymethylpyrimidine kinase/phosphomethylpyrimidine kinase [Candidatus Brocadia sp. AMX3]MDG5995564.1 bifunctional hydroxymethylpyrimidine kinase/phosphomethylpyrimidine kinase [Candidatus Brocadia sp.]RIK02242.1 MAG: bifunctional hydroxymethylpyrimidine kinase/phosphom